MMQGQFYCTLSYILFSKREKVKLYGLCNRHNCYPQLKRSVITKTISINNLRLSFKATFCHERNKKSEEKVSYFRLVSNSIFVE